MCQLNLGVLGQCLLDFPSAEAAFLSARSLAEETQAAPTAALACFYLAGLSRQRGRLDEAATRYALALQRFLALETSASEAGECLAGLAECAMLRPVSGLQQADRLLKEAAQKCKPADPFLLRARWRRALLAGQDGVASQLLEQALASARKDEPEVSRELERLRAAHAK